MGARFRTAEEWARYVGEDAPHDLAEVERQLWLAAPHTLRRARLPGAPLLRFGIVLANVIAVFAPLMAATVFLDGGDGYRQYSFGADVEFPVAFVAFLFGGYAQLLTLAAWRRRGGRRDAARELGVSAYILLCAAATLLQGYQTDLLGFMNFPRTAYLLPAWISGVLAVVTIVASLTGAPPGPPQQTDERRSAPIDLSTLSDEERMALLRDRHKAIAQLHTRGLLTGGTVEELSTRPLGALTVEDPWRPSAD